MNEDKVSQFRKHPDTYGKSKIQLCIHEIPPDWCHTCKHKGMPSVEKQVRDYNIEIVRRIRSWPKRTSISR